MNIQNVEKLYNGFTEVLAKHKMRVLSAVIVFFILFAVFQVYVARLNTPPLTFPYDTEFVITEGSSIQDVARQLKKEGFVRSSLYARYVFWRTFKNTFVQSGSYLFMDPATTHDIVHALTHGEHRTPEMRVTFPEGFRITQMPYFLPNAFETDEIASIETYEGYLFPDTYYIAENDTILTLAERMKRTFLKRIDPLMEQIEASPFSLEEIVIFASILEREGSDEESMRTIAGILLSRLEIDMPLQVDATFHYIMGKASHELTRADLKVDSPFNTYTNKGLPPAPIANPGLTAIEAVLNPIDSEHLYYLTGNNGIFYYAPTFEEHVSNKFKYLR